MTHFGSVRVRDEIFTVEKTQRIFHLLVDYDIIPENAPSDGDSVSFMGAGNSTTDEDRRWFVAAVARVGVMAYRAGTAASRSSAGRMATNAFSAYSMLDTGYSAYQSYQSGGWSWPWSW